MVESGELLGGEVKYHRMQFQEGDEDKHEFNVRLHLISGEADLFLKVCKPDQNCDLTKDEKTTKVSTKDLKISVQKTGIKTVDLPVICSDLKNPTVPDNFVSSQTCVFGIFIVGKNKDGKGKVHYELSVEDTIGSHLLIKNHFLRVNLNEGQTKLYHYNFRNVDRVKHEINATLDSHFGEVQYCLKKSENMPDKNDLVNNCLWRGSFDGDAHGSISNLRQKVIGSKVGAENGKYYMLVKAMTQASISIGFMEKAIDSNTEPGTYVMRNLKAGILTNDRIYNRFSARFYTF